LANSPAYDQARKNKHRDCHADHDEADNAHSASKRQVEQISYRDCIALRFILISRGQRHASPALKITIV
jgi:hypothetical protein